MAFNWNSSLSPRSKPSQLDSLLPKSAPERHGRQVERSGPGRSRGGGGGGRCGRKRERTARKGWRSCATENGPVGTGRGAAGAGASYLAQVDLLGDGTWKNLTCGALALVAVGVIDALCPVQTRGTGAVVNIDLAHWPRETWDGHKGGRSHRCGLCLLPLRECCREALG